MCTVTGLTISLKMKLKKKGIKRLQQSTGFRRKIKENKKHNLTVIFEGENEAEMISIIKGIHFLINLPVLKAQLSTWKSNYGIQWRLTTRSTTKPSLEKDTKYEIKKGLYGHEENKLNHRFREVWLPLSFFATNCSNAK